jgi:putative ABC transport system permease protein
MIKLILITAFRSLLKYRNISLINLIGLIGGLASFLFALHYIVFEFSYDSFFPKHENVYRVNREVTKEGEILYKGAKTPSGLFFAVKEEIPEVEANALAYFEKCQVLFEDTYYANQDVLWVSEDFEKVFPLEMVSGIADYYRPRVGIISETAAKALFRDKNPVGEIMEVNGEMPIEITGVFKDLPSNTHLTAQYFISYRTWIEMGAIPASGNWGGGAWWNYIRLQDGASSDLVLSKINGFTSSYMGFLSNDNRKATFSLQPLRDLHFIKGMDGEMGAITNFSSLINLAVIALFTLIIAWINYVNLLTAHTQIRIHQIKMRKLVGATNMHIWHQSLAETIILNLLALVVSFVIYRVFLNPFARLFNVPLQDAVIPMGVVVLVLVGIVTLGVLLSSMYYGVDLAKSDPAGGSPQTKKGHFKQGLVVVQMALSIIFLIGSVMVYRQISYMKNKDLGLTLDGVILCTGPASMNPNPKKRQIYQAFKDELLQYGGFESVSFNLFVPGIEPTGLGHAEFHNPSKGILPGVTFYENNADEGFIDVYELNLLAGKNFNDAAEQNYNDIMINESALNLLGFDNPEEAVGNWIFRRGNDTTRYEITGVVADFHNEGLQKPIYPIVWNNSYPREFGYFAIRVNTNNLQESVNRLREIWNKHYTKDELDFAFADQQFNRQYESENRYSSFYLWLTLLSIFILTIGLYGLIVFYLGRRKKEISLRKVNGATIAQIVFLLNKDFLIWVGVAFLLAVPVGWYAINAWLRNFAYRTDMSWWVFLSAGLFVLILTILTVSWQSYKAASKNPVEELRYE